MPVATALIMLLMHKLPCVALALILIVPSLVRRGEAQQPASQSAAGDMAVPAAPPVVTQKMPRTFVFVHWNVYWRKEKVERDVQQIVDEMIESLGSKGVLIATDPLRKTRHSSELFSVSSLLSMTKDVEASHLLYLSIWPRATAQCFDLSGRMEWQEEVKGARAAGVIGHNVRVMMKRLKEKLEPRIGTTCLQIPKSSGAAPTPAVVEAQQ